MPDIRWVNRTVTGRNPCQLGFSFALWAGAMIARLILKRTGVRLSLASVDRFLAPKSHPPGVVWIQGGSSPREAIERQAVDTAERTSGDRGRDGPNSTHGDSHTAKLVDHGLAGAAKRRA